MEASGPGLLAIVLLILQPMAVADSSHASFVIPLNGVEMEWVADASQPDGGYYRSKEPFQPDARDIAAYCRLVTFNCYNRGFFPDHFGFAHEDGRLVARAGLSRPLVERKSAASPSAGDPVAITRPTEEAARPKTADAGDLAPPQIAATPRRPDLSGMGQATPARPAPRFEAVPIPSPVGARLESGLVSPSELPAEIPRSKSVPDSQPVSVAQRSGPSPAPEIPLPPAPRSPNRFPAENPAWAASRARQAPQPAVSVPRVRATETPPSSKVFSSGAASGGNALKKEGGFLGRVVDRIVETPEEREWRLAQKARRKAEEKVREATGKLSRP